MKRTWLYLNNPFMIAAQKSYRQGLKLSTYYDAQLQANVADPFFADLYTIYHPLHLDLSDAYSNWLAQGGTLKGETLTVDQLLKLMSPTKVNEWEHTVAGVYTKGTPQYVALFPRGRRPFNTGAKEIRIATLKQFSTNLTGIAALAVLKVDVDNFLDQLTTDRQTQLGGKGTTKHKSIETETAIEIAMNVMHGDFGSMFRKFSGNTAHIGEYFDVNTIRNNEQVLYKRSVKAGKVRNVMQHTFGESETITLVNDGTVALYFYLAPNDAAPMEGLTTVKVEPNSEMTVPITDLGEVTNTFLNVFNNTLNDGHCIVELM